MINKKILSLCLATSMVIPSGVALAESVENNAQSTTTINQAIEVDDKNNKNDSLKNKEEVVIEEGKNLDLIDQAFPVGSKRVSYGVGLSAVEKEKVNALLGISGDYSEYLVYGADCDKYLGFNGSRDADMISSVIITKEPKNTGIKVNIKTPDKITRITEGQYTNAAITAGVTDVTIDVASPKLVTGESALTGVYKSLEDIGESVVDPERTELAQEELKTVSKISQDNKDNEEFDSDKLDLVVISVKQDVKDEKDKNQDKPLTEEQIRKIIEDNLQKLNLENVLSNNNINVLVNYFNQYQNSPVINSKIVSENLEKFASQYKDKANEFYNENKDAIDSIINKVQDEGINENTINEVTEEVKSSGLWDAIVNFFKSLFGKI